MKNILLLLLLSLLYNTISAQTTAIPDPAFEQALIDLNIDSDGIINGQVLTSDISTVTELEIEFDEGSSDILSLTGIEGFINLQKFTIRYSSITSLDISQNIALKDLDCSNNWLSSIDVSNNTLLEQINVGNNDGDVGPFNNITEINLSNNPNIKAVYALDLFNLTKINLKNNSNNPVMSMNIGFSVWDTPLPEGPLNTVCIQVDDEMLAQDNQFPYSEWTIEDSYAEYNFSETCALSTSKFQKQNIVTLYPNPATDVLHLTSNEPVTEAAIYNLLGQKVKQVEAGSTAITTDVSSLTAGTYFVVVKTNTGSSTEKLVIK